MKIRWNKSLIVLVVLLCIASVIGAVAYSNTFQQKRTYYDPAAVTEPPLVISQVQGLQITEVRLVNQGTPWAAIEIDVTNNRDAAVMSIDFIARNKHSSGGIAMDGLLEEHSPRIIIPPHTLRTFTWHLGEIIGEPAFLAAAIFADGKEEGDQGSLDGLRKRRSARQLEKKIELKNGGQQ